MDNTPQQQKLLLEYLISSPDTFALCNSIIKPEYFNPKYRKSVTFLQKYYEDYSAIPSIELIEAHTDVLFNQKQVTPDQIDFCANEVESFCKTKGLEMAIIEASTLLNSKSDQSGNIEALIRDAVSISLNKDLGVNYFKNARERLELYAQEPQRVSTGWGDLDKATGGGIAPKELILVSANSGGGKSIVMANYAVNMILKGKNVLYLSLELSQEMIEQRINTMLTGISTVEWTKHIDTIAGLIEDIGEAFGGHLNIKRMHSGTNANQIRAYIKEYQLKLGITPDILIVDYLDLMSPNERISHDNISQKDKLSAEQLCDILQDYKMIGMSASQQNRAAIDSTDLNQSHIAGGLTKINAVDWYFSIIFNPTMKAAGTMTWQCLKARSSDAVGKQLGFVWDNTFLRIKNVDKPLVCDEDGVIIDKVARSKNPEKRRNLKDMLADTEITI